MPRRTTLSLCAIALATLVSLAAGCGPTGPQWVDSGHSYSTKSLSSVYAQADMAKLQNSSASDTAKLRHDALVGLRKRGGDASKAADLITSTLPANSKGVPIYVERATVNGQHGLILVEAIGPPNGKLNTKQLWVLSDAGAVLFVGTRSPAETTSTH